MPEAEMGRELGERGRNMQVDPIVDWGRSSWGKVCVPEPDGAWVELGDRALASPSVRHSSPEVWGCNQQPSFTVRCENGMSRCDECMGLSEAAVTLWCRTVQGAMGASVLGPAQQLLLHGPASAPAPGPCCGLVMPPRPPSLGRPDQLPLQAASRCREICSCELWCQSRALQSSNPNTLTAKHVTVPKYRFQISKKQHIVQQQQV
ncbi:hypothetical protein TREES_T100010472 [Tupaia chinensis]|uniref:Uncharacterized protein n=1 Tax=Tupaia chinensis TaxID=246437 RepID=L9LBK0_TUPCH|nr:hypothetical protein TREES_T100010472 [Tupaia chinensis]